jgi:hypothetical protein
MAAYRKVILLVSVWLVVANVFALLALNRFNLKADDAYAWMVPGRYTQDQGWSPDRFHVRWDAWYYVDIAKNGYSLREDKPLSNIVFFPLYPFLVKAASLLTGSNFLLAGWLVSSLFLFGACAYLYRIADEFHEGADPLLAVFLLLVFPTAFFLNAVYTEALFLFLSAASFYHAMKRQYVAAGIFGFLSSLTRVTGVLLFLPLLLQTRRNEGVGRRWMGKSLPLLLIPAGTLSFFTFHWIRFGDPLLFFRVESAWGRFFNINTETFLLHSRAAVSNLSLDVFYLLFGVGILGILLKRRLLPYALYVGSTLAVAVSTGTLMSVGRYMLVLFPIYFVGASLKNETARYAWIMLSAALMALNSILFVNWYWAG